VTFKVCRTVDIGFPQLVGTTHNSTRFSEIFCFTSYIFIYSSVSFSFELFSQRLQNLQMNCMLGPFFRKFAMYGLWGNQKCYFDRNTLLNKELYCICFVNGLCACVWMSSFSRTFNGIFNVKILFTHDFVCSRW
jgi:hypothetical protein